MRRNPNSYAGEPEAKEDLLTANYWLRQPEALETSHEGKLQRSFSIAGLRDRYLLNNNEDPVHRIPYNTSVDNLDSSESFNFFADAEAAKPASRKHSAWLKFLNVLSIVCPLAAFFTFWVFRAERSLNVKVRRYLLTAAWMLTIESVIIWAGLMALCLVWFFGDSGLISVKL